MTVNIKFTYEEARKAAAHQIIGMSKELIQILSVSADSFDLKISEPRLNGNRIIASIRRDGKEVGYIGFAVDIHDWPLIVLTNYSDSISFGNDTTVQKVQKALIKLFKNVDESDSNDVKSLEQILSESTINETGIGDEIFIRLNRFFKEFINLKNSSKDATFVGRQLAELKNTTASLFRTWSGMSREDQEEVTGDLLKRVKSFLTLR